MDTLSLNARALPRTIKANTIREPAINDSHAAQKFKLDEGECDFESNNYQDAQPSKCPLKVVRCYRPKVWSSEVEEAFRVQQTGWKDIHEYTDAYGPPGRWGNGAIKCTRVKRNGYYTYWRENRECDDKYLHGVKLYEYTIHN